MLHREHAWLQGDANLSQGWLQGDANPPWDVLSIPGHRIRGTGASAPRSQRGHSQGKNCPCAACPALLPSSPRCARSSRERPGNGTGHPPRGQPPRIVRQCQSKTKTVRKTLQRSRAQTVGTLSTHGPPAARERGRCAGDTRRAPPRCVGTGSAANNGDLAPRAAHSKRTWPRSALPARSLQSAAGHRQRIYRCCCRRLQGKALL